MLEQDQIQKEMGLPLRLCLQLVVCIKFSEIYANSACTATADPLVDAWQPRAISNVTNVADRDRYRAS